MATRSIFQSELGGGSGWARRRGLELLGVVLLLASIALATALWGHEASDPSFNHATSGASSNPLGHLGASVADMSKQTIGRASWILPLVLALWGVRLIAGRSLRWPWLPVVALPLALLTAAAYLATWPLSEQWPYWVGFGGYVGDFLLHRLERPIGPDIYPLATGLASLLLLVLAVGVTWRDAWQASRATAGMTRRLFGDREPEPEPRWAQAVHQRLGARGAPAAETTEQPEGQRLGLMSRLLGGLTSRLRRGDERRRDDHVGRIAAVPLEEAALLHLVELHHRLADRDDHRWKRRACLTTRSRSPAASALASIMSLPIPTSSAPALR